MSDEPGGRPPLPVPRPAEAPTPPAAPSSAERLTSPRAARVFGLTPQRAAAIVRQSSNARWVGFLATLFIVVFVIGYYFYELGFPLGLTEARQQAEAQAQQVTAVERGYNIYEANCARCHGPNGEGGIGPKLNDQSKLFWHLKEPYLRNILLVGGRYACGNANSLMPVWSDQGTPPGPLNYVQINDLIAFLRATNDQTYIVRDPTTNEPVVDPATGKVKTFTGWRDPNWKPAPGATPYPDCWQDEFKSASSPAAGSSPAAPSPSPSAGGSSAPSGGSAAPSSAPAAVLSLTASGVQFTTQDLTAPANTPFQIRFDNQDAGVLHNVDIHEGSPSGRLVFDGGDPFAGVATKVYDVPALPAGTYAFVCRVHPTMVGTLTVK
jgi:mono/diheme cytochrome c family protein/plastocyanin